jgi:hypothetical protein
MAADEYKVFLRRFVEQVWEHDNLTAIGQFISTRCIYHDTALDREFCGNAQPWQPPAPCRHGPIAHSAIRARPTPMDRR